MYITHKPIISLTSLPGIDLATSTAYLVFPGCGFFKKKNSADKKIP